MSSVMSGVMVIWTHSFTLTINQNKSMITLKSETAEAIKNELESIPERYHKPFNSNHEGYAILLEEVRELENEIFFGEKPLKKQILENSDGFSKEEIQCAVQRAHNERIKKEAIQVAAMAVRIIQELT